MTIRCRALRVLAGFLLLAGLAAAPLARAQGEAEADRDLIAVLDLNVVGGTEVEGVAISNSLREELLKTGRYKLINRNQMEAVLEEQALQQVACTGTACVADVGKVLGVAFIVTGSVTKISPELMQVSASLIDVSTAETLRAESILHEGNLVTLLRTGIPSLAAKLANVQRGQAAPPPVQAAVPVPQAPLAGAVAPAPAPAGPLRHAFVQKRSMPSKRKDVASAVLEGKIYVLGGRGQLGLPEDRVDVYDSAADGWNTVSRMPSARANVVAVAAEGGLYAIGGYNPLNGATFPNVDRFDAASQSWTPLDPLPVPVSRGAGAAAGGKLYLIGGEDEKGVTNAVYVYDPAAKKWGRTVDAPIRLSRHAVAVLDGLLYVTGGYDGSKELNTLFVFDPVLNTWAQKAPLNTARAFHASAAVAGRVFVFGGEQGGDRLDGVEEYDPATKSWIPRTKLPRPLSRLSAAAQGGKIYLIGGDDGSFGLNVVGLNFAYE
jgi:N-acetylneuraminic acid mutarotase/TolB-like protein